MTSNNAIGQEFGGIARRRQAIQEATGNTGTSLSGGFQAAASVPTPGIIMEKRRSAEDYAEMEAHDAYVRSVRDAEAAQAAAEPTVSTAAKVMSILKSCFQPR